MPVPLPSPAPMPTPNSHKLRITMAINEMISKVSHIHDSSCCCHSTSEDPMPNRHDTHRRSFESSAVGERLAAHVDSVAEALEAIRRAGNDKDIGPDSKQDPSASREGLLPLEVTDTARSLRRVGRRLMVLAAEIELSDRALHATKFWQEQVGQRMSTHLDELRRVVELAAAGGLPL